MDKQFVAKASTTVDAPIDEVWDGLVNPQKIKKYMFGTTVLSDWEEGSSIVWKGEYEGKKYEDKGKILRFQPQKLIQYTHYSPLSGIEDKPEYYHTVNIELSEETKGVLVSLTQDNNPDEQARKHSEKNWSMMLKSLKQVVESQ